MPARRPPDREVGLGGAVPERDPGTLGLEPLVREVPRRPGAVAAEAVPAGPRPRRSAAPVAPRRRPAKLLPGTTHSVLRESERERGQRGGDHDRQNTAVRRTNLFERRARDRTSEYRPGFHRRLDAGRRRDRRDEQIGGALYELGGRRAGLLPTTTTTASRSGCSSSRATPTRADAGRRAAAAARRRGLLPGRRPRARTTIRGPGRVLMLSATLARGGRLPRQRQARHASRPATTTPTGSTSGAATRSTTGRASSERSRPTSSTVETSERRGRSGRLRDAVRRGSGR